MKNWKNYKIFIILTVFVVIFSAFALVSSADEYDIAGSAFTAGWELYDNGSQLSFSQGISVNKIISGTDVSEGSLELLLDDYVFSNTGIIPDSVFGTEVFDYNETYEGSGKYDYGPVYPFTSAVSNVQSLGKVFSADVVSSDNSRFDVSLNYVATEANRIAIKDGLPTLVFSFVVFPSLNFDSQYPSGGTYYVNWKPQNPTTGLIDAVKIKINGKSVNTDSLIQTVSERSAGSFYVIGKAYKYNIAFTIDQKSTDKIEAVNTMDIEFSLYNGGYKFVGSSSQTTSNQNIYPIFRMAMSDIGLRTSDMSIADATSTILSGMNGQTDKILGFFSEADEATTKKIQQAVLQVENTDKEMADSINNFWNMLVVPEDPFAWFPLPFFSAFMNLWFSQTGWGITVVTVLVFLFALRFITSSAGQWFDNISGLGNKDKKDKGG